MQMEGETYASVSISNTDYPDLLKYREAFRLFDVNSTGDITIPELQEILGSLGFDVDDVEVSKRLDEVDVRKNGVINFDEFMKVVSYERVLEEENEMMLLFRIFDPDQLGYVTKDQLKDILQKLGFNFTDKQIQLMVEVADTDGNQQIHYDEFVNLNRNLLCRSTRGARIKRCRTMSVLISNVEIDRYREAFRLFDIHNTNTITIQELRQVFERFGFQASSDEIKQRLQEVDQRKNGVINFDEFIDVLLSVKLDAKDDEMEKFFRMFDINNNGYINSHDFRAVMKNLGFVYTDKQVDAMLRFADIKGDGRISFEEFVKVNSQLHKR